MIDYETFKKGITSGFGENDNERYVQFAVGGVGKLPDEATDEDIEQLDEMLTQKLWDAMQEMFVQVRRVTSEQDADNKRRQAMLSIIEPHYKGNGIVEHEETARVPVFVWPTPTTNGLFIVEHQDGTVQRVQPDSLTLLGSKELFEQYAWGEGNGQSSHQPA